SVLFFFNTPLHHPALHSFPTRRSSDLPHYPELPGLERFSGPAFHSSRWEYAVDLDGKNIAVIGTGASAIQFVPQIAPRVGKLCLDRKSTRLNSSHVAISYAVFCLKKKK